MGSVIAVQHKSEDPAGSDFLRKYMKEGTTFAANACTSLVGAPGV
ncbi:hypothetical protein ACFSMW_18690 [Virgibacillus halophilus]